MVPVDVQVAGGIRGWIEIALHDIPLQIKHYHVMGAHLLIAHTRRLDRHQPGLGISGTHIATGPHHQVVPGKLQMPLIEIVLQVFKHGYCFPFLSEIFIVHPFLQPIHGYLSPSTATRSMISPCL